MAGITAVLRAIIPSMPIVALLVACWVGAATALVHDKREARAASPRLPRAGKPLLALERREDPPKRHESVLGSLRGGGGVGETSPKRIAFGSKTWVSRLHFSYINPLLKAGADHPLQGDELPDLDPENMAERQVASLETAWLDRISQANDAAGAAADAAAGEQAAGAENAKETATPAAREGEKQAEKMRKAAAEKTLLGAVWATYGSAFLWGGGWKVPQDILSFAAPFLVKAMYRFVDPKEDMDPAMQTWSKGLGICLLFFCVQYVASVALHQYFDKVSTCV